MQKPIRILHQVAGIGSGGFESLLINLHRNIDTSQIQFDYILSHDWGVYGYQQEMKALGGRIYQLPEGGLKQFVAFYRFLKQHPEYTIVHCHRGAFGAFYLVVAKMAGIKHRICHSHYSSRSERFIAVMTNVLKPLVKMVSTKNYACGEGAGEYLFGSGNYEVLKNSLDLEKFKFPGCRLKKRNELGYSDKDIVYGHVGHFNEQKNNPFLIDVFYEIQKKQPNAKLLMVGDGELLYLCMQKIKGYGIEDSVRILSHRTDVNELLQVIDIVIFPSRYEGFSVAMLEMQAASLRILTSDTVSTDINLTGEVYFKTLADGPNTWADEAIRLSEYNRNAIDVSVLHKLGYDIKSEAKKLQMYYMSLL